MLTQADTERENVILSESSSSATQMFIKYSEQ